MSLGVIPHTLHMNLARFNVEEKNYITINSDRTNYKLPAKPDYLSEEKENAAWTREEDRTPPSDPFLAEVVITELRIGQSDSQIWRDS